MLGCLACFSLNACVESSSRLTWALARDNALLGSKFIGTIHPRLQVPVWALVANSTVIFVIGCVYLGSSTAFNAFIGCGLLLQQCCFAMPAALLLWNGRSEAVLPKDRYIRLGAFGWVVNVVTLVFAPLITIMYCFPVEMPVTASNMSKYLPANNRVKSVKHKINYLSRLCKCRGWRHDNIGGCKLVLAQPTAIQGTTSSVHVERRVKGQGT